MAGEIFAAPGAVKCIEALRDACAGGESALFIVLNHAGDVLAANIAMQAVEREGLNVKMLLTDEDISSPAGDRRGLVGCVAVYKVAGAAAENGASLEKCLELAQRMADNMRTLAVAVRTATHPATGQPIFELGDDEMEIGMGQHGEAGTGRMQLKTANETAEIMLEQAARGPEGEGGRRAAGDAERRGRHHADGAVSHLPPRGADARRRRESSWCAAPSASSSPPRSRPASR